MRALAVLAAAILLVAVPGIAEGKRSGGGKLRGSVRTTVKKKAPKRWKVISSWATATPTPRPSSTPGPPGETATPAPTATPGSSLPPQNPRSVSVGSTEFSFTLSQASVLAGEVRVQFDNSRAEDPHQLAIDGPDPDFWVFEEVGPGVVTSQTIVMREGRHVLYCPLPEHEELGMRAVLTVR